MRGGWLFFSVLVVLAPIACRDRINDERQAALGPEQAGVPNGPLHRPGQPCTVCHRSGGGAPTFALAGTVFASADSAHPVQGALVQVIESDGNQRYFPTNEAGNFYVSSADWTPRFPLWTSVGYACNGETSQFVHADMQTQIFRATACADCHLDPRSPSSTGHVYLSAGRAGPCP